MLRNVLLGNEPAALETCKLLAEIGCRGRNAYLGLTPTAYLAITTNISKDTTALDLVVSEDLVRDNAEGRQLVRLLNKVSEPELIVDENLLRVFFKVSCEAQSHVPPSWKILYEQGIFSCKDEGIGDFTFDDDVMHSRLLLGRGCASRASFYRMFFALGGSAMTLLHEVPLLLGMMYRIGKFSFTSKEEQNEAFNSLVITISLFFEYGLQLSEERIELLCSWACDDLAFIGSAWILACLLHGREVWLQKWLKHTDMQDLGKPEANDASSECGSCTNEGNGDPSDEGEDTVDERGVSQNEISEEEQEGEEHEEDKDEGEHREAIQEETSIQRHDQRMPGAWIEDDGDSEQEPHRTHSCDLTDFKSTINGHFWDPDIYVSNPDPEVKELLDVLRKIFG